MINIFSRNEIKEWMRLEWTPGFFIALGSLCLIPRESLEYQEGITVAKKQRWGLLVVVVQVNPPKKHSISTKIYFINALCFYWTGKEVSDQIPSFKIVLVGKFTTLSVRMYSFCLLLQTPRKNQSFTTKSRSSTAILERSLQYLTTLWVLPKISKVLAIQKLNFDHTSLPSLPKYFVLCQIFDYK